MATSEALQLSSEETKLVGRRNVADVSHALRALRCVSRSGKTCGSLSDMP
jgi:hypothetical protein